MRLPLLTCLFALCALLPSYAAEGDPAPEPPPDPWTLPGPLPEEALDGLDYALAAQLMTRHDLSFQKDPVDDPYRLSVVTRLLDQPLELADVTWEYGHKLESGEAVTWLGSEEGYAWLSSQLDLAPLAADDYGFTEWYASVDVPHGAEALVQSLSHLQGVHGALWDGIAQADREVVAESGWMLARGEQEEPDAPEGHESLAKFGLSLWDGLRWQGEGLAWARYLRTSSHLLHFVDRAAADLARFVRHGDDREWEDSMRLVRALESQGFDITVGDRGPNSHTVRAGAIVIDPGGDDSYRFVDEIRAPRPLRHLVIDLEGNDLYTADGLGAVGGGYLGTAICYDAGGDDVYRSRNVSQGAGLYGFGALIDKGGRDLYDGGDFTQGAGMFGFGLLLDEGAEDDAYRCTVYGQACALTGGMGLLLERGGDDTYYAGGKHPDFPRWPENTLSLSQGFAIGIRPIASGGIAFLGDYGGNDFYSTEVYGQGVSYWYSLGMLLDKDGWDWYDCLQYGQGTGIHLSAGCLIDMNGTDHYNGWALLQGSGHDLGTGVFIDMAGNDFYNGRDLVQGAGQANGLGLCFDLAGDDTWFANSDLNQGYGNSRRDYGSIGVLIDVHGKDLYSQPDRGDGLLWTGTTWGACLDMEDPEHPAPVKFFKVPGTTGAQ
ncbi:MAG TPA: hypothetical protein VEI97_12745 [bacterium]|nr:hypothetical protein [bacterium]